MKQSLFFVLLISVAFASKAQKKPLDHTVYDGWQSIGERVISDNGKIVVYTITPQEGDATLVIQQADGKKLLEIPRGYGAKISSDAAFVICKVKPAYQQTREAKIKKKKADDMPKDSLAIAEIAKLQVEKYPRVKSFKMAKESAIWLAWQYEKEEKKKGEKSDADDKSDDKREEGTLVILKNLVSGTIDSLKNISEYVFDEKGNNILLEMTADKKSKPKSAIIWRNLLTAQSNILLTDFADARGYVFNETGTQLAFIATFDTTKKEQKEYSLHIHQSNQLTESLQINNNNKLLPAKWRINENGNLSFSKSGKRVFFGTSPSLPPKDTSLPEFERVNVDVWYYNEDDLQTVQLKNLDANLKKSYLAVVDVSTKQVVQLANEQFERVIQTAEGDGTVFYATSNAGYKVARQWEGFSFVDIYRINPLNGVTELIQKKVKANVFPSYTGKYLLWYNEIEKKYFIYNSNTKQMNQVAKDIRFPLFDEENDVPDDPNAYGIVKWMENDQYVLIYDRYDIWRVDPLGKEQSMVLTDGRSKKVQYRYVTVDADEKFISDTQNIVLRNYNETTKQSGYTFIEWQNNQKKLSYTVSDRSISNLVKAKNDRTCIVSIESAVQSPDIFSTALADTTSVYDLRGNLTRSSIRFKETPLSNLNPQQAQYNWLKAELFKWKAYTGKEAEGIIYKPEDFDPKKKYPMIVYFYERLNQTLFNYLPPSPTPSRLNIPFFVSRGYIVFVPDIWYAKGKPGKSAYDYILSGTRAVVKAGFVDSNRIGLQGQSWGGYQTAQLITMTNLYKAAWAGAPVSNMFSAYGGIRWESGLNRQFQYEHQQSRIGATIWDRQDLYIENSPLFHLKKVKTPLVIMHNDKDGAVPWYQGIELFTAMRRLNKPVWMLNYNDEAHNLVERKNRKDIQIREQQFFDWLLKGEKPATWLSDGVPAIMKGRTWGL